MDETTDNDSAFLETVAPYISSDTEKCCISYLGREAAMSSTAGRLEMSSWQRS